jgi:hypothetical protein
VNSYIHSLEERVASLEILLQRHGIQEADTRGGAQVQRESHHELASERLERSRPDEQLLAAGVYVTATSLSDHLYLGSGSGVSFTQTFLSEIKLDGASLVSQDINEQSPANENYISFEAPKSLEESPTSVSLPERSVADHLTTVFFELASFSFPILHEPTFRKQLDWAYERPELENEESQSPERQRELLFSYMVFAIALLALQKRDTSSVSTSVCERYHEAALLCLEKAKISSDIQSVQSLLLLANYSYLHPSFYGTWKIIGMALRLAVEIGLHKEPASDRVDALTLDTRRRVFWVAYSMDRNVGWFLGRPFGLADEAIDAKV